MLVPWTKERRCILIPDVAQRGLKVRQLWDLTIFLKRLCKAKCLLRSNAARCLIASVCYRQPQADEHSMRRWLDWHELNLYDITEQVIKKFIPYNDRYWQVDESDPLVSKRYSWAELVSAAPQRPHLMISHWWGGRFADFISAVDQIVEDRALSICTVLWICTFANNQFGESFGARIMDTPFARAIEMAEATILIVDRDAGSLTRSWCCLELHCTIALEKELQLYTSNGMVGSAAVSSGPLVDAISRWDVRKSEAAELAYKRQILNFIAEVPETHGLVTDCGGNLCCVDGRPQVAEGDWALLQSHSEAFDALNMDVRVSVLRKIGSRRKTQGCVIDYVGHRGVTLGQLRTFSRKAQRQIARAQFDIPWEEITVADICEKVVKKETAHRSCSYVELIADGPQIPQYCINYQFATSYADVMSSIEWFAEACNLKDSAVLWFNLLSYNQHDPTKDLIASRYEGDKLIMDLGQSECHSFLISAGNQLSTNCVQGFSMTRAWRLYSLECATRLGQDIYVACRSGVMACTRLFPNGHSKYGSMDPEITEIMYSIDVERVAGDGKECTQDILRFINDGPKSCGLQKLKRRMQRWAAGHLVPFAASCPDCLQKVTLDELCNLKGFSIHSVLAKGNLGQSSLHEAVAADCIELAKKMLAYGCLANAADSMQETPLHYAAMRGNVEMTRLLLEGKADSQMESRYGETAYDVARQNAAEFIHNKDSAELVSILCAHYLSHRAGSNV